MKVSASLSSRPVQASRLPQSSQLQHPEQPDQPGQSPEPPQDRVSGFFEQVGQYAAGGAVLGGVSTGLTLLCQAAGHPVLGGALSAGTGALMGLAISNNVLKQEPADSTLERAAFLGAGMLGGGFFGAVLSSVTVPGTNVLSGSLSSAASVAAISGLVGALDWTPE